MKKKWLIVISIIICLMLVSTISISSFAAPKTEVKPLITIQNRLGESSICTKCGKSMEGIVGEQNLISIALGLDICNDCFWQILYGNDYDTPVLSVAQLGEDGKVLSDQLPSGQGAPTWGSITGTLSSQIDLDTALSGKEPTITAGETTQYYRGDKTWQILPTSSHSHSNLNILDAIQESFTTSLKTSYDWLVTNITSTWKSLVDNHLINTNNPHSVTKEQIGLSNVTDDAQIPKSIIDAKGDILTATSDNTPALLAIGDNNQVLTVDSSTSTGLKWATPSSGGESETIIRMSGDVANNTTTLASATGVTFTADANSTYIIEGFILWNTSATTVGIKIGATASGSPTVTSGHFTADAASGTPDSSSYNANDVSVATGASAFTTGNFGELHAILITSGSTSTWQLRFAAETTGTITLKAGTTLRYRKVS